LIFSGSEILNWVSGYTFLVSDGTPDTWERLSKYMLETESATLGGAARLLDEVEQLRSRVTETSRSDIT